MVDAHTAHCVPGTCKYGDADCPVQGPDIVDSAYAEIRKTAWAIIDGLDAGKHLTSIDPHGSLMRSLRKLAGDIVEECDAKQPRTEGWERERP